MFIIIPALFLLFDAITLIVFLQFLMLSGFFLAIILGDFLIAKIIIQEEYIEYHSIFKKYPILWNDVKSFGTFEAVGLTIVGFDKKKNFLSKKYIYMSTRENLQINTLKRNCNWFIRFNYNGTLYNIIIERYKNAINPKDITL